MDSTFLLKLTLSFAIGGLWIVLATVLADRLGPKIGGLVSGLPSTVMFGLFFLGWTQSPSAAVQATTIIPLMGGINCLFLGVYAWLVRHGFWRALFASLALWALLAYLLVGTPHLRGAGLHFNSYPIAVSAYACLLGLSFVLMEKVLKIKSVRGRRAALTPLVVVGRGLVGGCVVALAVYLGKTGGPLLGGMFSMFPAMFLSTMLVTYYSQGAQFSAATMKSSLIGAVSVVVYSVVARYSYVPLGLWLGTLAAVLVSFGTGFVIYRWVIVRLS
jgi:uncharacterized membrane protein (GlpM family)